MKNLDLRYGEIPTAEQFITRQRVLQSETAIYVRESLSPCLQGRSSSARWVHLLLSEAGFRLRRCQRNQSFKDPARINACASAKARRCCCCCRCLLLLSLSSYYKTRVWIVQGTQHALHSFFLSFFFVPLPRRRFERRANDAALRILRLFDGPHLTPTNDNSQPFPPSA